MNSDCGFKQDPIRLVNSPSAKSLCRYQQPIYPGDDAISSLLYVLFKYWPTSLERDDLIERAYSLSPRFNKKDLLQSLFIGAKKGIFSMRSAKGALASPCCAMSRVNVGIDPRIDEKKENDRYVELLLNLEDLCKTKTHPFCRTSCCVAKNALHVI